MGRRILGRGLTLLHFFKKVLLSLLKETVIRVESELSDIGNTHIRIKYYAPLG